MISNYLYIKVGGLLSGKLDTSELDFYFSISKENLNLYETTGREGFSLLQAHQNASGLEYFSGVDISLALKKLADRENEKINVIIGGTDEIVIHCYINESFTDILIFLYFKPHKKSDKEILEEKRILGLSD